MFFYSEKIKCLVCSLLFFFFFFNVMGSTFLLLSPNFGQGVGFKRIAFLRVSLIGLLNFVRSFG